MLLGAVNVGVADVAGRKRRGIVALNARPGGYVVNSTSPGSTP